MEKPVSKEAFLECDVEYVFNGSEPKTGKSLFLNWDFGSLDCVLFVFETPKYYKLVLNNDFN